MGYKVLWPALPSLSRVHQWSLRGAYLHQKSRKLKCKGSTLPLNRMGRAKIVQPVTSLRQPFYQPLSSIPDSRTPPAEPQASKEKELGLDMKRKGSNLPTNRIERARIPQPGPKYFAERPSLYHRQPKVHDWCYDVARKHPNRVPQVCRRLYWLSRDRHSLTF